MLPEEGNASRRCRCLLTRRLMGLAFDPVARGEGWAAGVVGAPVAGLHAAPPRLLLVYLQPNKSFSVLFLTQVSRKPC